MALSRKFILWSSLAIVVILLAGGSALRSVWVLSRATAITAAEYDAADRAEAINVQVAWLRDALRGPGGPTYRAPQFFAALRTDVDEVVRELAYAARVDDGDARAEVALARDAAAAFADANRHAAGAGSTSATDAAAALDRLHGALQSAARLAPAAARRHVTAAASTARWEFDWTCAVLAAALAVSLLVHFRQYRLLVRPLLWLKSEMSRSAARDYREEVRPAGAKEFHEVASLFNGLARELADLYRGMERKIIERSRELVRSERLASVGFLAAGVAHEINNPLSVISGYAELAAKSLRRVLLGEPGTHAGDGAAPGEDAAAAEAAALSGALDAQEIIRDEAFRCKEITSRLLSLARGGSDARQPLFLDDVARQVATLTRGLKNYRDRRVTLEFEADGVMQVVANLTEMKQVLLNLTVNALEAIPADRGEVRIGGRRRGEWVELFVEDNGKGMNPDTLEHIFEPFFTAKRGAGEPGTGLGLSITHAIVENHGGRISAESPGPGRGSRFTIRLPASTAAAAAPRN